MCSCDGGEPLARDHAASDPAAIDRRDCQKNPKILRGCRRCFPRPGGEASFGRVRNPFRRPNDNAWTQADRRERWQTVLTVIAAVMLVGGSFGLLLWSLLAN